MRCGQEQAWDAHSRHGSYTTYCSPPPTPPPNTIITISTTATTRNKARGMRGSVLNMVGTRYRSACPCLPLQHHIWAARETKGDRCTGYQRARRLARGRYHLRDLTAVATNARVVVDEGKACGQG